METSLKVFLYLTWLSQLGNMAQKSEDLTSRYVHQEKHLISATVGEDVTLPCFHQGGDSAWIFWYKQSPGQMPRLISTIHVLRRQSSFSDEFNNTRFTVKYEDGTCRLSISDLHISDSATYLCASSHTHALTFAEGITVIVQGSGLNLQALVHHEDLSCTLHNESCGEGHSVYWLMSSNETHTGLIHTKGDMCDQRERTRGTQTHTCVHNLSLNTSGADYCAVLSCGHILYGNGTKLDSKCE
ncbi:uncharacterized protein LOC131455941 [Solea solea]|uniref:uncharacterized protein LOC131455941 n=1 Tax=Solea solea TaxID=90069 RepID=UPI00272DAA44|nr:uncharacterized protein LOC131455941 [Solea solea]